MSTVETAAPPAESSLSIRDRVSGALPIAGIGLALIVNAAWVGFLGYCIVKLI
jgi:hypothetical protein